MSQISPPIRILLVCAVAFLAAWMLFLRPSSDAGAPATSDPGTATTTPVEAGGEPADSLAGQAVEQANEATAAQDARAEELAGGVGETVTTPGATAAAAPTDEPAAGKPGELSRDEAQAGGLPLRVLRAIGERKVLVLLFWEPKAAEDKAVRKALRGIDRHDGKVLAHASHIKRIAHYQQITRGANVEQSPTIVVVDRNRQVQTLVGYVDRLTIEQSVADALRKK